MQHGVTRMACLWSIGLLVLLAWRTVVSDAQPVRQKVVCTGDYQPVTACIGQGEPSGYEVELFRRVADWLGKNGHAEWAPGNYTWSCFDDWDQLLADLQKPASDRQCDMVVSGISATPERKAAGLQFSYPTMSSGRRIMVYYNPNRGMWSFLDPFEPALWLAYFATSVFVGVLLVLAETPHHRLWQAPRYAAKRAGGLQWGVLAILLRMPSQRGGRLILAGYGFLVFILASLYVSSMSAMLSARVDSSDIGDMEDLTNRPVGIFVDDKSAFQRFALNNAYYLPWGTDEDEDAMMAMLRSGKLAALVLDSPYVQYTAADNCDLFIVGNMVLPVDLGFAFPNDTSSATLGAFDSALSFLDDTGVMTTLQRELLLPQDACHSVQLGSAVRNPRITLSSVSGLWVFLAGAIGLSLGWNLCLLFWQLLSSRSRGTSSATPQGFTVAPPGTRKAPPPGSTVAQQATDSTDCTALALHSCSTQDEALKAIELQLQQMDNLIRHMPFVMVASMDTRFHALRSYLLSPSQRLNRSADKHTHGSATPGSPVLVQLPQPPNSFNRNASSNQQSSSPGTAPASKNEGLLQKSESGHGSGPAPANTLGQVHVTINSQQLTTPQPPTSRSSALGRPPISAVTAQQQQPPQLPVPSKDLTGPLQKGAGYQSNQPGLISAADAGAAAAAGATGNAGNPTLPMGHGTVPVYGGSAGEGLVKAGQGPDSLRQGTSGDALV